MANDNELHLVVHCRPWVTDENERAYHAGRMLYHNVAGAATLTLPAINSSSDSGVAGPGNDPNSANNLGASFEIYIGTTKTGSFILQVANANDTMTGNAIIVDTDTNDNAEGFMLSLIHI